MGPDRSLVVIVWFINIFCPPGAVHTLKYKETAHEFQTEAKPPAVLQYEYARSALKIGLQLERGLGINPFKFGMVGSSDPHTALSTVEEENFFGKHSGVEPKPHRWEHVVIDAPDPEFTIKGWQQAASGFAAVWAMENTREAVFDAMKRTEANATTGTRITVRFFGGWEFEENAKVVRFA